ncbi:hypothetical protein K0G60_13320 [Bacteroides fragilis]|nr:hypothetical protein [Bacteroides fragilis]
MRFTTPCFIRKNTEELRKKLEDIGYAAKFSTKDHDVIYAEATFGVYFTMFSSNIPQLMSFSYDCGENEALFLAIAALRDDSNYMQWFICTEDYIESPAKEWKVGDWDLNTCPDVTYGQQLPHWRKATVEELINHFK